MAVAAIVEPAIIPHSFGMTPDVPHPYALTIEPVTKPEGHFAWKLRRNGKLIERSDRFFTTESKARENAMKAVEINLKPSFDRR